MTESTPEERLQHRREELKQQAVWVIGVVVAIGFICLATVLNTAFGTCP